MRSGQSKRSPVQFELLESRRLFTTFTVTNTSDSGAGSLHDAILLANENPGKDMIEFQIAASNPTIRLTNSLPQIADPVIIDGTTQPGFTNAPVVKLTAPFFGGIGPGNLFHIVAGDSTIRGLSITGAATAILIDVNGGNTIVGNHIGTDVTGTLNEGNRIGVAINTNNNVIGGPTFAERNIISASALDGIVVTGSGNRIENNFIGTDVTGTQPLGNALRGISLESATSCSILKNLISANAGGGVRLVGASRSNVLHGNTIGADVGGRLDLGNGRNGILIDVDPGAAQNRIGGAAPGQANLIAFNRESGVVVAGNSTRNTIRGNRVFANAGMALDLGNDNGTANDISDVDAGPNGRLNYPVLAGAFTNLGTTLVQGRYNGAANSAFTLDFYSTSFPEASGHGGAHAYLGSARVQTDASGNATFATRLMGDVALSDFVTTTATDTAGNTSEFAANVPIRFARLSSTGKLTITGTSAQDLFEITVKGTRLRVSLNGRMLQFDRARVTAISALLGDGDDLLYAGSGVAGMSIDGGRGNDQLAGGDGNDRIYGSDGNDQLDGRGGADVLSGGAGDDTLYGSLGKDRLYGGTGDDSLIGGRGADSIFGEDGTDSCDSDLIDLISGVEIGA